MTKSKSLYLKTLISTAILCCIALWYWYGFFISHPALPFNDMNGDGGKNYYTVIYHVLYDSTNWHFMGMNYPYGEHVLFTDNQPAFANALRFIHHHIIDLNGRVVLIMNLAMLLSIIICGLTVCVILLDFGVVWWYAALAASAIAFLSPQLMRFAGHYALAYSFYVPLLWLLWLRYFKNPRYFKSILICIVISVASLIHLYYLPIGIFFGCLLWLFYYLKFKPKAATALLNIFIQVVLPLLLVKVFISLTDHVTDRPSSPYGFMAYRSFWEGVFLPVGMPIGHLISLIKPIRQMDFESVNYVGLTSSLFSICLLYLFFKHLLTGKWRPIFEVSSIPLLSISFWAAFIILLFSMGLPFVGPFERFLKYTGPMQQFRSIGRFAWIFYYVINVFAFTTIYSYWLKNKKNILRILILSLSIIFIVYDNFHYRRIEPQVKEEGHLFNRKLPFNPSNFQAILPLPFYHIGSENFGFDAMRGMFGLSTGLSLKTGLPITATEMSRTSNSQTLKSIAFTKEEYRPLKIAGDLPSHKPLLIILNSNCNLGPNEKQWLKISNYIGTYDSAIFYSLSYDSLARFGQNMVEKKKQLIDSCSIKDSVNLNYYYRSFDELKSDISYKGGAMASKPGESLPLYNNNLNFISGHNCVVSFWAFIGKIPYPQLQIKIKEYNGTGELVTEHDTGIGSTIKAIDGDWGLVEKNFRLKNHADRFTVEIARSDDYKIMIYADELLLRRPGSHICMTKPGYAYVNNRFYPLKQN